MTRFRNSLLALGCVASVAAGPMFAIAAEPTGAELYQRHCASCHGAVGEGVPSGYPNPLAGDKSIAQLARVIDRTMPEGEPESVNADEANRIAEFIHGEFYSPVAQARREPPRIELSRLTVTQYRNTVADLVGSFRNRIVQPKDRGLEARYYNSRRTNKESLVIERRDPQVKFDWGEGSPDADKIPADEFAVHWTGSLLAPHTGPYEIVVAAENGFRLWLNDDEVPFIDGGVKSGEKFELRESMFLLGGRGYRLRLEMFKSKKGNDKRGAIALSWRPPHGRLEPIPEHHLSPQWCPKVCVVNTPFPPDDRSYGYERASSISKEWDQATSAAALEVSAQVASRMNELAGVNNKGDERATRVREFCDRFVERAFRRPLSDETKQRYVDGAFRAAGANPDEAALEVAVRRVVLTTLKSPLFLFREIEGEPNDPYNVASRLAYHLWDCPPDESLREKARDGKLGTRDDVREAAWAMVRDERTLTKFRAFLRQWLNIEHLPEIAKDSEAFPEFNADVVADLRTSLEREIEVLATLEEGTYGDLLNGDGLWLNGPLAKVYGAELAPDAPFQRLVIDGGSRRGLLTHPYLLAGFAYTKTSSPIHRGVFISRSLFGRVLRAPPIAVAPVSTELQPDLTTRERVEAQTADVMCQSCHTLINPLGFALEGYDAIGRLRTEEKGRPINALGQYLTREGELAKFNGAKELAEMIVGSGEARGAFAEQLFHTFVKQPLRAYGPQAPAELRERFDRGGSKLRWLLVDVAERGAWLEQAEGQVASGE
jgi:hypothetical protein